PGPLLRTRLSEIRPVGNEASGTSRFPRDLEMRSSFLADHPSDAGGTECGCAEQLRSGGSELSARRQALPDRVDELGKSRRANGVREHPLLGRLFEAVQEALLIRSLQLDDIFANVQSRRGIGHHGTSRQAPRVPLA